MQLSTAASSTAVTAVTATFSAYAATSATFSAATLFSTIAAGASRVPLRDCLLFETALLAFTDSFRVREPN